MYEASRAGDKLTSDQISKARNSERVKLVYQSPYPNLLTQVSFASRNSLTSDNPSRAIRCPLPDAGAEN